jgi:hypothetical protein
MKINKIFLEYINKPRGHKKEIGRYWASELGSIIHGYLKPADYLKEKKIKDYGMILTGIANENMLTNILKEMNVDFQEQVKFELKIKDIILVVKPDFVFKNMVWETKHAFTKNYEKYKYQLEAEYRATNKITYLGILKTPFDLDLLKYNPSDKLWQEIQDKLYSFHEQVIMENCGKL